MKPESRRSFASSKREKCYLARLSARSAMYPEAQTLLLGLSKNASREDYRQTVLFRNILSRPTFSSRKKIWAELSARYGFDSSDDCFRLFRSSFLTAGHADQRSLIGYVYYLSRDLLFFDLSLDWFSKKLREAPQPLLKEEAQSFLLSLSRVHPEINSWSPSSIDNIIKHYLRSLVDFGVAEGRIEKRSRRPYVGPYVTLFLVQFEQLQGTPNQEIPRSAFFRLLGMSLPEATDALFRLNTEGLARVSIQGDVVNIELRGTAGDERDSLQV